MRKCPGQDSNLHGDFAPWEFKSPASTRFASRAGSALGRTHARRVPLPGQEPLRKIETLLELRHAVLPRFQLADPALELLHPLRVVREGLLIPRF